MKLLVIIAIAVFILIWLVKRKFNNFLFLAKNITYIYCILNDKYRDAIPSEEALYITCGAIDAASYLQSNQNTLEDLKTGLLSAKLNECSLEVYSQPISNHELSILNYLAAENSFLPWVLQLEALMMAADSNIHPKEIIQAVISQKERIQKTINKTIEDYKNGNISKMMKMSVDTFMTSSKAESIREEIFSEEFLQTFESNKKTSNNRVQLNADQR